MNFPVLKKMKKFFKNKADFVLLFGSVLGKYFERHSDIDVGVYWKKWPLSPTELWKLRSDLAEQLDRPVDLIFLNDSDPIITMQILANGKLLWNQNRSKYNIFKARKISEYLDFKQGRAWLENEWMKKHVHA